MTFGQFTVGETFLLRVAHDSDLIEFLTSFAKDRGISAATFTAIGALKNAELGFYDQEKHEYVKKSLSNPQEIASCTGNISTKDGELFIHAHTVLADRNGNARGGHLLMGKVFAAEVHLTKLTGERRLVREKDAVTSLALWNL